MAPDLYFLVWSILLLLAQVLVAALGIFSIIGLQRSAGNREDMPDELPGWPGRAVRAHRNMLENLVPFGLLVVVAHLTTSTNDMTALGAAVFFYARLAYAVIYVAGIPWLRSLAWAVSFLGMILIAIEIM